MAATTIPKLDSAPAAEASDSLMRRALRRIIHDKMTIISLAAIVTLSLLSILAPFLTEQVFHIDPNRTNADERFLPIGTPGHLLGTDDLGRDHLARLLHAGRISLGIGFAGAGLTLVIGLFLGVLTGYFGGAVDDVMNWIITTLDSRAVSAADRGRDSFTLC